MAVAGGRHPPSRTRRRRPRRSSSPLRHCRFSGAQHRGCSSWERRRLDHRDRGAPWWGQNASRSRGPSLRTRDNRTYHYWHVFVSGRSEEHTSELQSLRHLVCRLLLEKKKKKNKSKKIKRLQNKNSATKHSCN